MISIIYLTRIVQSPFTWHHHQIARLVIQHPWKLCSSLAAEGASFCFNGAHELFSSNSSELTRLAIHVCRDLVSQMHNSACRAHVCTAHIWAPGLITEIHLPVKQFVFRLLFHIAKELVEDISQGGVRWLLQMKNCWWSSCSACINNTIIIQIKVVFTHPVEQLWAQWWMRS